ncbi:MAG TPA: ABC transporter permease, partial [Bryobacteraceae bacterium]|nr:ABC transporter permease [Bryobacteraceae bacterium]
ISAPGQPGNANTPVLVSQISSAYPKLVNTHLLQGRLLTQADIEGRRRVVMVNRKFASTFFPKGDALGQNVRIKELHPPSSPSPGETVTIIGVLSDLPNEGLGEKVQPETYVPFTLTGFQSMSAILLARSALSPTSLVKPLEEQIHKLDPDQPVMEIRTYREWLDLRGYSAPKFSVFLFSVFAALGLLLASLGIYAVMNYSVLRQTQEIGLRMALGAQRSRILSMIVASGTKIIAFGVALGLLASLASTTLLRGMLSGVSPFDPLSFMAVVLLLFLIGLVACLRPAWRAARIDPMRALHYE